VTDFFFVFPQLFVGNSGINDNIFYAEFLPSGSLDQDRFENSTSAKLTSKAVVTICTTFNNH
jgi:hypothetical protein